MQNTPSSGGVSFGAVEGLITGCLACGLFHCCWHPATHRAGRAGEARQEACGRRRENSPLGRKRLFLTQPDLPGHVPGARVWPWGLRMTSQYESWSFGGIDSTSGLKDPRVLQKGGWRLWSVSREGLSSMGSVKFGPGGHTACVQWDYKLHVFTWYHCSLISWCTSLWPPFRSCVPPALCSFNAVSCARPLISRYYKWISVSKNTFFLLLLLLSTFYSSDPAYLFPLSSNLPEASQLPHQNIHSFLHPANENFLVSSYYSLPSPVSGAVATTVTK